MTSQYGILTQWKESDLQKDLKLVKKGDILFFHRQSLKDQNPTKNNKYPGHCGLYLGNQSFIHASKPKHAVVISNFDTNPYWSKVLVGSKNLLSDEKVLEKSRNKKVHN